jgi:hypothetical protein
MNTQSATNNFVFVLFIGFSLYNLGYILNSQLQHFALYSHLNPNGLADYMTQNNKFAVLPAVVPGFTNLLLSLILIWLKPAYLPDWSVYLFIALNVIVTVSTFIWQRSLHVELAEIGFDAAKIQVLLRTNWIRTIAYAIQGITVLILLKNLLQQINSAK